MSDRERRQVSFSPLMQSRIQLRSNFAIRRLGRRSLHLASAGPRAKSSRTCQGACGATPPDARLKRRTGTGERQWLAAWPRLHVQDTNTPASST